MSVEIAHIRHVGLFSPDLEEHSRFYSDVWGLQRLAETPDAVFFRGSSPEYFILSLHRGKTRGLHHIAYAMHTEEAVREAASLLDQTGVRIVEQTGCLDEAGTGYGFRFIDPDGRCIEFSAGIADHRDGWHSKVVNP
ncbi:MAG TPA: VOC family protein, partial [Terriglobia bacterium]|nr:VOC family protein [Terriglobia bacterium]